MVVSEGKSLDKCMQMKEAKKCHIVGEKKKKSKGKTAVNVTNNSVKKKKKDVFAFINNQLKGRKGRASFVHSMSSSTVISAVYLQ